MIQYVTPNTVTFLFYQKACDAFLSEAKFYYRLGLLVFLEIEIRKKYGKTS